MLPLLPMSILYFIFMVFFPEDVFKLVVMTDQFTFNWTEGTLTFNIFTGLVIYDFLLYFMHYSALLTLADFPEVTGLVALCAHLAICWALPGLIEAAAVSTCLLCRVAWLCSTFWASFMHCSGDLYFVKLFMFHYTVHCICLTPLCLYSFCPCWNIFTCNVVIVSWCHELFDYFY